MIEPAKFLLIVALAVAIGAVLTGCAAVDAVVCVAQNCNQPSGGEGLTIGLVGDFSAGLTSGCVDFAGKGGMAWGFCGAGFGDEMKLALGF